MKELPESGSVRYPLSPTLLRTLSHSPVPAAAISETLARHPEFSPRQKSLDWNRFDAGPTIRDTKGNRRAPRKRSESIGSLRSLQQTTAFPAYRRSSTTSLDPPIRSVSNPIPTAPNSHTSQNDAATNSSNLADLSWGKWWPFAIVEPEAGTTSKSDPSSPDSILATRSFLELFAGKGVTSEAEQQRLMQKELDEAEGELLKLDLDELRIASQDLPSTPPPAVLPPRPIPLRHSSSRQYLPTTTFSSGSTVAPHPPFSPLLSPSLMSPPGSPSGVRRAAHHGRHYSSGPGTSRKEVDGFLDEEDKKRAKLEEEQGMDMFDLIRERYRCPLHPIVFCHGLFGFDVIGPANFKPLQFSYWIGVKEALEAMGVEVLVGRVPASAGIEERAKVLAELIEQTFPGREINLIGHSMGGLDARFLISKLKPTTFKIRSLTTIATPHRGSSFADFLLEDVIGKTRVPALLSMFETIGIPGGGKAFEDLTVTKMERFNSETPDDPNVQYFSYGAEFEPGWSNAFRLSWGIMNEREGQNDGLVSVESAKWGEYRGTLHNVNHLDLVGWVGKVRFGWAELLGRPIKFKPVSFYCAISEMLADKGL